MDKYQSAIYKNFASEMWLGKQRHVERLIEWTTFFRRNLHLFAITYLGLSLHLYQIILLYLMGTCSLFVLVAARASAKSYLIAIYSCCKAILYPGSRIVVASATKQQAKLIVTEKIKSELMNASPNLRREIISIKDNQNEVIVFFRNGSTLVVVPALETARGHRSTVLVLEEFRQIDKTILDTVLSPFAIVRTPPYKVLPYYSDVPELIEESQSVFISSSWMRSHWMFTTVGTALDDMYSDKSGYVMAMDYSITLKHTIRTRKQLIREKKKLDPMSWAIEYENLAPRENTSAFFPYGLLTNRQVLRNAFYPRRLGESLRGKLLHPIPKQDGELRIVSCDIALMSGSANDNSCYSCMRLLPDSEYSEESCETKTGYRIEVPYIETCRGMESTKQVLRIKQLYADFDGDYIVLDCRNSGLSLYDLGARITRDDEFDCDRPAWLAMNNDDIAARVTSSASTPNVYCIIASQRLNSDIAFNFRQMLNDKKIDFLINTGEATEILQSKYQEYLTSDGNTQLFYESPYLETLLAIHEASELQYEKLEQTGQVRVKEIAGHTKDRYTSLSYGAWMASELSRDLMNYDDVDYSSLPSFVSSVSFD